MVKAWFSITLLCCLLSAQLGCLANAGNPTHDVPSHRGPHKTAHEVLKNALGGLLFSSTDSPIPAPFDINIALIGFDGDGAFKYKLDEHDFAKSLQAALPDHTPSCVETGKHLHVKYQMKFHVKKLRTEYLEMVETALHKQSESQKPVPGKRVKKDQAPPDVYSINVRDVEPIFEKIYDTEYFPDFLRTDRKSKQNQHQNAKIPNTIIVVNPSRRRIFPSAKRDTSAFDEPTGVQYQYRYDGGAATQTWVSHRRYVVVDLTAGPVEYGATGAAEGTVSSASFPRLEKMLAAVKDGKIEEGGDVSSILHRSAEFRAQLGSLVISAIEHIFVPDVAFDGLRFAEKVLVPIIVLRNHNAFNPLSQGQNYSIDIPFIKREVEQMALPNQEIHVVSGLHELHDHRHVAMAVSKALRADTTHEVSNKGSYVAKAKPYLDSNLLERELRDAADQLAAGLMTAASTLVKRTFYNDDVPADAPHLGLEDYRHERDQTVKEARADNSQAVGAGEPSSDDKPKKFHRSKGVRVIPVYVFSLLGYDPSLLLDRNSLVAAKKDVVMVLQTSTPGVQVPYRSENRFELARPLMPTRHIVSGIAQTLGALVPPYQQYSHTRHRVVENYLWANGHHPFGPFSHTSGLSQLYQGQILRNNVVSRLDAALRVVRGAVSEVEQFAAKYMYNPFGDSVAHSHEHTRWIEYLYERRPEQAPLANATVAHLHRELRKIELLFKREASLLNEFELHQAYTTSNPLLLTASAFQQYVKVELEAAHNHMWCFKHAHEMKSQKMTTSFIVAAGLSMLVTGLVVYYAVTYAVSTGIKGLGRRQ